MKKTATLLSILSVAFFWTAVHKYGGDPDYELVLKPYPSFTISVGGGEEHIYQKNLENGVFPFWLKNGNYIKLAYGSWESSTQPWEYIRGLVMVLVFLGWPVLLSTFICKSFRVWLNKRFSGARSAGPLP